MRCTQNYNKTRRKSKLKPQYRFLLLKPIENQMVVRLEYSFFIFSVLQNIPLHIL